MDSSNGITYDVTVIGGGYAGIAAALQVARAHRRVLVIDAGRPRDRFCTLSHDFIGLDEKPAAALAAQAKQRLLQYGNVRWLQAFATYAYADTDQSFVVTDEHTVRYRTKRLVLASGVVDTLPKMPGVAEKWGKSISLSPYYTAYSLDRAPVGVLATDRHGFEQAMLLADWGPVTLFTNDVLMLTPEQSTMLTARGVLIEQERVVAVSGTQATVQLADRRGVPLAMLFMVPPTRLSNPIARQLNCEIRPGISGEYVVTDASQETSVRGVFACGDMARVAHAVSMAVGDGTAVGVAVHRSLVMSESDCAG